MMHRFLVDPRAVVGKRVTVRGPDAHHLAAVLRLRPGDQFVALDGSGLEHTVRLTAVTETEAAGEILETREGVTLPLRVTLVQGVPKGTKMDLVIRMGTELGIAEFVPARAARSVAGAAHRAERWRRIAQEAAKQSRRADVPRVHDPAPFADAVGRVSGTELMVVLWEGERSRNLADVLRDRRTPAEAALIVGPEGGFEREEVEQSVASGAVPATLGPLILRTETAGIAAAAMLFYEFGLRRR
ncbi:MAG: RsmE family RNA methyltransferase [bacterium]